MSNYSQGDIYAASKDTHFPQMESQHSEIDDFVGENIMEEKCNIFSHIYFGLCLN